MDLRIFFVALLCGVATAIESTGPSDDPIYPVNPPNLPAGRVAVDAPPGPFFQDFPPPYPTDAWWSGFTVSNQDSPVAGPFPFQAQTQNTGLSFGISEDREFDGTSIHQRLSLDWRASFTGLPDTINNRKATSWDTQTVCLMYFSGVTLGILNSCLVPGSPYFTLSYSNAAPVLTSLNGEITNFQYINPGTKARVTNSGGTYLIYVLGGTLTLNQVDNTLVSSQPFTGTLRIAKLVEPSQEAILDAHVDTIPTKLTMSYTVTGDVSEQVWEWETQGPAANLLILSWPHHRTQLVNPNYVNIQYLTLKGYMKGIVGNRWVQRHNLPTISWFAANNPHPSCVPELIRTLEVEVRKLEVMVPGDFYFWGGAFARAAQLATIAEHVGRADLIQPVISILKQSIEYWFDPTHKPGAAFETGWGGFVNSEGWNNTWVDFGNAYYNDHHFHYGYILHGAAVIGKYDPAWLNQHLDFFLQCARNTGNPSPNDPHYTVTRHFDFFAGHSWASGIANGAGPRDQESSGEAINGYYGLLLFAHAINNQPLIDWSRILVAMEIAGAKAYWHLYPTVNDPDTPYPEQAFKELVTVGNVMDTQAGAWLFWGADTTQIAAIQILPLTPIGQYTYDQAWMEQVLIYCKPELDDPAIGDAFKSVILAAYAVVNPQEAFLYSRELFDWGTGNSASNQLYFVSTQPSAGDICQAGASTPEGLFTIQDVASGKFVSLAGAGANLAASAAADVLATKFELEFTPGGSTILALSNGKYVTASSDGSGPLSASRDAPQSFETFRWAQEADGTYELQAMVNRQKVGTVGPDGTLVNNGAAAKYRLVPSDANPAPPLPATGVLKSLQTNQYVTVTDSPTLYANSAAAGGATRFAFERVEGSPDTAPLYAFKTVTTNNYVTADISGTQPLQALRAEPQAWEHFQFVPYQGGYIVIHAANSLAVAVQPDNTLIDNNSAIDAAALWAIE